MKIIINLVVIIILAAPLNFPQFGKNKVQYKEFTWYYIQTDHFDIYFTQDGSALAEFAANAAENALASIQSSFEYRINNRVTLIVYNSQNDFQETNVIDQSLSEGVQGFTELFKNRVVVQFNGSYKMFRHLIHHELVHAVINDMFYGGSLQNAMSNNLSINLPLWFNEGMAEYQALKWDVDTDMFIRDAATSEYLPDIEGLDGYFAYRGGQAVFNYIAKKYGEEKIGELINKIKATGNVDEGFKSAIGLNVKELNERWKKDIKRTFWPDISIREDADEFAKRLTDHREDGGFYNTSPAISPQGDKIAFITNRDFYYDLYLMNANDGKIIRRLIKGNRSPDFEELNIVTPGLSWSPDGSKIALSAKSGGWDVVYIINSQDGDIEEILSIRLDAIQSVTWSNDGKRLAFIGQTTQQSDVYIYDFETQQFFNLTNDIFSEITPAWSNDDSRIFFSSDRGNFIDASSVSDSFKIYRHNYDQNDLYEFDLNTKQIRRITNSRIANETSPINSPDGKELLFISDENGINNIYKKSIVLTPSDTIKDISENPHIPITNSISGLYQISSSRDGKKVAFSTLYQAAFNIFLINNPFESENPKKKLEPTLYMAKLLGVDSGNPEVSFTQTDSVFQDSVQIGNLTIMTGSVIDTNKTYGDSVSIDFGNYVFGNSELSKVDTSDSREQFKPDDNLDEDGNFKVNKYKITFAPDLIYANAAYSSLYGLLGTTVISFSDVLGNHRLIGLTSLQIDLKNSDYGLAYYYLPERVDYGIELFHTARFVYLDRGFFTNLYRFRNFGAVASISYPLNRYYRFDFGLSWLNLSSENLDDPDEDIEDVSYVIPSMSFVQDNVLWGYTSPIDGTRYRIDLFGNPGIGNKRLSFYSITADYRNYSRFWYDYSFVMRFSGGYSGGANSQRFFIGGIENWINRTFSTTGIPIESASDFAFLTAALPLRGFNYAELIGTKYGLVNLELRFPLIRYLVTGALPILFSNILGVAFIDAGTAWNNHNDLQFFTRDSDGNLITKDLLIGTGFGARLYLLYFLLRFDVAWAYNAHKFSQPKFYFSLGTDF
jgi:Tol biopolymer transport system component